MVTSIGAASADKRDAATSRALFEQSIEEMKQRSEENSHNAREAEREQEYE